MFLSRTGHEGVNDLPIPFVNDLPILFAFVLSMLILSYLHLDTICPVTCILIPYRSCYVHLNTM